MAKSIKRAGIVFFVAIVLCLLLIVSFGVTNTGDSQALNTEQEIEVVNAVPVNPELEYALVAANSTEMAKLWNEKIQEAVDTRKHIKLVLGNNWLAPTTEALHKFGEGVGFDGGRIYVPHFCTITLDLNGYSINRGLSKDNPVSLGNVIKVCGTLNVTDSKYKADEVKNIITNGALDSLQNYACGKITGGSRIDNVYGGGGIFVEEYGTLNFYGGMICDNFAVNGGAIHIRTNSTMNMYGGIIVNNKSSLYGGGIYLAENTKSKANDIVIYNNVGAGGGIFLNTGAELDMNNINVVKSSSNSNGGGVYVNNASLTATNITVTDNISNSAGGGICVSGTASNLNLTNFNLSNNTANYGGGIVFVGGGEGKIKDGSISNNTAKAAGGGLHIVEKSKVQITNCDLLNNQANSAGGGCFLGEKVDVDINGAQIKNNQAESGGGIYYGTANMSFSGKVECSNNSSIDETDNLFIETQNKILIKGVLEKVEGGNGIFIALNNNSKFSSFTSGFASSGNINASIFKSQDGKGAAKVIGGEVVFDYYSENVYDFIYLEENERKSYKENDKLHGYNDNEINMTEGVARYVLGNITPNTSVNTFIKNIASLGIDKTNMELYDSTGKKIYENGVAQSGITDNMLDNRFELAVGTGWCIKANREVIYLSVLGDINGDGRISASDVIYLREIANDTELYNNLNAEVKLASLIINKGKVTSADSEIVLNVINKKLIIDLFY